MGATLNVSVRQVLAQREVACAVRETSDSIRAEEALLGPLASSGAWLVLREPEVRMARGWLRPAMDVFRDAGGSVRVIPSGYFAGAPRAEELYAAVWELDALRATAGDGSCPVATSVQAPAWLEPESGAYAQTRAADGWLCHSFAGRREHAREDVARLVPRAASRVLELGCASGALGALLERSGAHVTGVEPDPEAARAASSRISRVVASPIEQAWGELGTAFDAIVAADVLEHLEDPVGVLRELLTRASDGCVLVAAVPNATHASVLAGALQGRWDRALEGVVAYGHRTYAGRAGWKRLLRAGGWAPERWEPLELLTRLSAPWRESLAAAGLDRAETAPYQWLVVARKAIPSGEILLGESGALSPMLEDPAGFVEARLAAGDDRVEFPNALSLEALEPLFSGDVVCGAGRRALASGFSPAGLAVRFGTNGCVVSIAPGQAAPLPPRILSALTEARRRGLEAEEPCAAGGLLVTREPSA